jgi:nicotinate-nucleotide adenylyltransferase
VDISGYEIRRRVKEGRSFRYLVPEQVYRYILKKGLYK